VLTGGSFWEGSGSLKVEGEGGLGQRPLYEANRNKTSLGRWDINRERAGGCQDTTACKGAETHESSGCLIQAEKEMGARRRPGSLISERRGACSHQGRRQHARISPGGLTLKSDREDGDRVNKRGGKAAAGIILSSSKGKRRRKYSRGGGKNRCRWEKTSGREYSSDEHERLRRPTLLSRSLGRRD